MGRWVGRWDHVEVVCGARGFEVRAVFGVGGWRGAARRRSGSWIGGVAAGPPAGATPGRGLRSRSRYRARGGRPLQPLPQPRSSSEVDGSRWRRGGAPSVVARWCTEGWLLPVRRGARERGGWWIANGAGGATREVGVSDVARLGGEEWGPRWEDTPRMVRWGIGQIATAILLALQGLSEAFGMPHNAGSPGGLPVSLRLATRRRSPSSRRCFVGRRT